MNEDYPVFKKWSDILDWILDSVEKFPKSIRFTISTRISNLSLEIIELIIEAIYSSSRFIILKKINLNLEKLRVFFRIAHARRYISIKQFEFISRELVETGRMIGGWMKQAKELTDEKNR